MYLCKQSSVGMGIGVYVCVIINQISSIQLFVCVCNGSTPGSAVRAAPQMCVCLCTRKIKGGHGCVYVRVYFIISLRSTVT